MIQANNVTLRLGKRALFEDVNIKFTEGNCYGLIGANGAGKSTFLKILSGEIEPSKGDVSITSGQRLSVLKQDHYQYDDHIVLDTVMMGNQRLYEIMKEKEALYAKDNHEFRITFDQNILWRNYDLSLCRGIYGEAILAKNKVLMEVKTAGAIPLWMVHFLTENQIYKTSFSKYATAYRTIYEREKRSCPPENFFVFTGDEVVQQAIKC